MARLASLLKGGYYPLSDLNTQAVESLIMPSTNDTYFEHNRFYTYKPYTLIDPFCGAGAALAALSTAWNAAPYGVELHPGRGETARERLGKPQVLIGPAEGLVSSGFDIVYSNPPYDNLVEVKLTLIAASHVLPGGLLVTVLPEKATARVLDALTGPNTKAFTLLFARLAPDPEWNQVVAVLKREKYAVYAEAWEPAPFEPWAPPKAPFKPETSRYCPRDEAPVKTFKLRRVGKLLDAAEIVAEATDVLTLVNEARRAEASSFRPLTPLRPGHLAALLASGLLEQVEIEVDGRRLALKGTTEYVVTHGTEVQGDKTYAVERRAPQTSLAVLDLDTGEIEKMTPYDPRFTEVLEEALPALLAHLKTDLAPVWTGLPDADRRALAEVQSPRPEITGGLLPSQMDTASAMVAGLSRSKCVMLIGEMGSGKTLTSLGAWHLLRRGKPRSKLAVICPPHLVKKWKREAAKALPYARVSIVKSVGDVDAAMRSPSPAVLVMSHSASRDGSGWEPAAMRMRHLGIDRCPTCGQPVELLKSKSITCPACATPLWQQTRLKSGRGKYPLADYLRKHYRHKYDLVLDELQDFKSRDSQRAIAAHRAIVGAGKVLALTGTAYGGKSSTVFYLFQRFFADFRAAYSFNDESNFVGEFGTVETRGRVDQDDIAGYGASWAYKRSSKRRAKEAPGVSPGIISWALPHAVFLSLEDVAPDLQAALPPYHEHIHLVDMDPRMTGRYKQLDRMREAGIADLWQGSASLFSTWMMAALGWPDNPATDVRHTNPESGDETVWLHGLRIEAGEKEKAIVQLAAEEVAAGRKVAIYAGQTHKRDPAAFLRPLLEARGLKVEVLRASVDPSEREQWLMDKDCDVLITNPKLVETGVDLLKYQVLIFNGVPSYSCYTLQQAARRSWRIGQEQPVDVHFFAYRDTLQDAALQIMAAKAAAATAFNGEALEALAAFGDSSGDLLSSLRERVLNAGEEEETEETALEAGETVLFNDVARDLVMAGEAAQAHDLLPAAVRDAMPPLYATEGDSLDAVARAKWFTPDSSWSWFGIELDPDTGECFGLVVGHAVELGYFNVHELGEIEGPLGLKVERDLWFEPTAVRDLVIQHRDNPGVQHVAVHVDEPEPDDPVAEQEGERLVFGSRPVVAAKRKRRRKKSAQPEAVQLSLFSLSGVEDSAPAQPVGEQLALFG